MSTTPPPDKLTDLERQRLELQKQLAAVEAAAAEEKKRSDEQAAAKAAEQAAEQARREKARRALLQQEAARLAAERLKQEQEAADHPTAPPTAAAIAGAVAATTPPAPTPPKQPAPPAEPPTAPPSSTAAEPTPAPPADPTPAVSEASAPADSNAAPPTAQQSAPADSNASPAPSEPTAPVDSTPAPTQPAVASPQSPSPSAPAAVASEPDPTPPVQTPVVSPKPQPAVVAPTITASEARPDASIDAIPVLGNDSAEASEEGDGEEGEEPAGDTTRGFSLKRWIDGSPPVLVSAVFHAVGLFILGLMTLALQKPEVKGVVMEASEAVDDSMLEELSEVELEPTEMPEELENLAVAITEPDPGMIAFSDVTAAVNQVDASEMGEVQLQPTTIGEIGALFGEDGKGMSDVSDGMKAATFFGAKSTGSRFVFIVDNSNSMGGGKFETVIDELVRSVQGLSPRQRFYVIFFSDTAYPLFHPDPAYGMVTATPQNITKLKSWLYTVEMCLRTKGRPAVEQALKMSPDAIYILGDGAFTDDTAKMLTAPHERTTVIHTIGMQVNDRGRQELTAIAKANGGTFRSAQTNPAARAMAKANPIKKNNAYGPVWGTELPGKKK